MRKIDRRVFHKYLWTISDRNNILPTQQEIARMTDITYQTISDVMKELREGGMLKKNRSRVQVVDPAKFTVDQYT